MRYELFVLTVKIVFITKQPFPVIFGHQYKFWRNLLVMASAY